MLTIACRICGQLFSTSPARIAEGRGTFCSRACYWESKRKRATDAWALVDRSNGPESCWEWQGTITVYGYGQFKCTDGLFRAHRLIYTLANGPISEGMVIRHRCDNRRCCNPAHLEPGTHDDNMDDMNRRGRRASGDRAGARTKPESLARGERHHKAKLTDEGVRRIRALREEGETYERIAAQFGVSFNTVRNIMIGKIWKHVV